MIDRSDNNTNNNVSEMPKLTTLATIWYADTLYGEKTQISLCESIPALEEAPEQITGSAVDIDYEFSQPGKTKAGTIEIPVYYTHTQHQRLKNIERQNKYIFVKHPDATAPSGQEPLVRYFQGSMVTIPDEMPDEDWAKDKLTIYRATKVEESYGFPVQSNNNG